jgi:hypothetical protein
MFNLKSLIFSALAIVSFSLLQSCTEEVAAPEGQQATLMTIDQIKTTKGYTWYQSGYDNYNVNKNFMDQVKAKLMNTDKNFVVFVNPSCACVGTQEQFPSAVKILQNAGINEPTFKVYTMKYPEMKNPYTNILQVKYLPALFIIKDNVALKSVFDSLHVYKNINPDITLEEAFLKCLN